MSADVWAMSPIEDIVEAAVRQLEVTIAIIDEHVEDGNYHLMESQAYGPLGTIGRNFRHMLNFYDITMDGYEARQVDFLSRHRSDWEERNARLETDRGYALEYARELVTRLREGGWEDRYVFVRGESGHVSRTSFGEVIQTVISHTVHHESSIAEILGRYDISLPERYGLSAATKD